MNKDNAALTLGIDLGGTNTAFAIVDTYGKILVRGKIPTPGHESFAAYIDALHSAVRDAMEAAQIPYESLAAIGVGAPCIDSTTGVIEGAVNLPWPSPIALTYQLSSVFGLPAAGDNDANAAALGEMCFGSAKELQNFIMITLGTGVGSAIVCDGHLLRGKRGLAGELGHTLTRRGPQGRKCCCGRRGCLDVYASASGVVTTARELLAANDTPSTLRGQEETLTPLMVSQAATGGDEIAREVFRLTGEILGEACADFTAFSSPVAFIFFGGVAKSYPLFEEAMLESFKKTLLWVYDGQVDFRMAALPETDAALLGAAAIGRQLMSVAKD